MRESVDDNTGIIFNSNTGANGNYSKLKLLESEDISDKMIERVSTIELDDLEGQVDYI